MRQAGGAHGPMGCKAAAMTQKPRHGAGLDMQLDSAKRTMFGANIGSLISRIPNHAAFFTLLSRHLIGFQPGVVRLFRFVLFALHAQNPGSAGELGTVGLSTRKSSRLAPASIFSFNQFGCLPFPAQVHSGFCGS